MPPLDLLRSLEVGEWESPYCCMGKEEAERSWEWWGGERKTSWAANKEGLQLQSHHQEDVVDVKITDNGDRSMIDVDCSANLVDH